MINRFAFAALLAVCLLHGIASAQIEKTTDVPMSTAARAYLDEVFTFIRENAVFRERLDWQKLRAETYDKARGAETPADTYTAVRYLVGQLQDNGHSAFFPADPTPANEATKTEPAAKPRKRGGAGMFSLYPSGFILEVLSSGQAEAAGMRVGDQILTVNGKPNSEYQDTPYALSFFGEIADGDEPKAPATGVQITFKRAGEKEPQTKFIPFDRYSSERIPTGRRLKNDVGYIEIPMMLGQTPEEMTRYAERVQQAIRDIDSKKPVRRWIVDLRRNQGGNSWPMLAGIGPLLGEGVIGALDKRPGGNGDTTEYRDGQAISSGQVIAKVGQPYKLKAKNISVAVLTGPMTASSGEFVALWFRGLPNTRSFGEPSHGVPTANIGHRFSDGSGMNITIGLGLDRQGREYAGPVPVDTEAASSWPNFATEKDPAIAAAMRWLRTR